LLVFSLFLWHFVAKYIFFPTKEYPLMKPCLSILPAVAALLMTVSAVQAHELPEGAEPFQESGQCASCHPQIFKEWQESFHAKSSVHTDSAHNAVYQAFSKFLTSKGKKPNYHCANCHAPMSDNLKELMSGDALPDSKNASQVAGVGCTFCHRIEAINPGENFNQYRLNKDGAYHIGRAVTAQPKAHKIAESPLFTDGEVCMGCHGHKLNSHETPICLMTDEGKSNCITCHLPKVAGSPTVGADATTHFSHTMAGGHDLAMLQQAADLEIKVQGKGMERQVVVTVQNKTEHTFPSTNPMRMAFIKVQAKDKNGTVLWENFKKDPLKEDRQAVFFKAFKAGEQVGVPSWQAESLAFDTRLKRGESKVLTYPLYSNEISEVEAELVYLLFPPKAFESFAIPKDGVNDKRASVVKKSVKM
jgi:hypothetical protein